MTVAGLTHEKGGCSDMNTTILLVLTLLYLLCDHHDHPYVFVM